MQLRTVKSLGSKEMNGKCCESQQPNQTEKFDINARKRQISSRIMSFLGKGKKADLIKLAIELGECESNGEELKIIELKTKILTNDAYKEDPEFVKCIFEGIVSNRIDEENKQKEQTLREFELQKIRLKKMRLKES
ncbi:uncharacterized protein TNCV_3605601 [Trichonephila clavipes]|uniref:Uncharacterized protein n=1 Tax=Trichonephila clavipes TaxID=2585209 RepID=A0A8X6UW72_TRICX|nr:uncharacterized protein TNCV_3605601 [Trichonephila clavipes]